MQRNEIKIDILDLEEESQDSKHGFKLIDPVGNPISRAVVFKDPQFAACTYDIKSVEDAFNIGELKPFRIEAREQLRNSIVPRHLINSMIEFINNEGNTTEAKGSILDAVYESPVDYEFPQTPIYFCTVDGHSYGEATRDWILRQRVAPGSNTIVNEAQIGKDWIAEKLLGIYQGIKPPVSQKEFYKILINEFNHWREPVMMLREFYCHQTQNLYLDKLIPILTMALLTLRHFFNFPVNENNINLLSRYFIIKLIFLIDEYMVVNCSIKFIRSGRFGFTCVPGFSPGFINVAYIFIVYPDLYHLLHNMDLWLYLIRVFSGLVHFPLYYMVNNVLISKIFKDYFKETYRKSPRIAGLIYVACIGYLLLSNPSFYHYYRFLIYGADNLIYIGMSLYFNTTLIPPKVIALCYLVKKLVQKTSRESRPVAIPHARSVIASSVCSQRIQVFFAILAGIAVYCLYQMGGARGISSFCEGVDAFLFGLVGLAFEDILLGESGNSGNRYCLLPRPQLKDAHKQPGQNADLVLAIGR